MNWRWRTAGAALLACAGVAGAQEPACDKTLNGQHVLVVDRYPVDVAVHLTVSTAQSTSTPAPGQGALHAALFSSPGDGVTASWTLSIGDYAQCRQLAKHDDTVLGVPLNSAVRVSWTGGSSQCGAQLVCLEPQQAEGATRSLGFYMVYEQALRQCLEQGPISLGIATVGTVQGALGLLWAAPTRHASGAKRGEWDRSALLLSRQLMVAVCNERLLGKAPDDALATASLAALEGTDCARMRSLEQALDAFNRSGDRGQITGFDLGRATPRHAQANAEDPTVPTTNTCQ